MNKTELVKLVDEQAKDEGLWFVAQTAPEAYLQSALRKLHAAIEDDGVWLDLGARRRGKSVAAAWHQAYLKMTRKP